MKPQAVTEKRKDKIPYEHYKEEFAKISLEDICKNKGVVFDNELSAFKVKLLNEYYSISYPSGEVTADLPNIKFSLKTLLLRYLISCKDIPTTGKMINYRDVPDGNLYYQNFYGRCLLRLSKTFKGKFEQLIQGMEKLNGERLDLGDISFKVEFLPNITLYLILYKADDEFPESAQILFSENASFYFSAEDLAVVGDILNDKLLEYSFKK